MPHCSSYACSNSTVKDTISQLYFCYPLNRPGLKQWSSGFVGIDSHRHSAVARRPGWIDLTMKTTINSRQTSPHVSFIHIHTHGYKNNRSHFSNDENSQNKRADLDGSFFGGSAVTVKSLYKLALHKILLDDAFMLAIIYKPYFT